jgi:hypothetical protein
MEFWYIGSRTFVPLNPRVLKPLCYFRFRIKRGLEVCFTKCEKYFNISIIVRSCSRLPLPLIFELIILKVDWLDFVSQNRSINYFIPHSQPGIKVPIKVYHLQSVAYIRYDTGIGNLPVQPVCKTQVEITFYMMDGESQ